MADDWVGGLLSGWVCGCFVSLLSFFIILRTTTRVTGRQDFSDAYNPIMMNSTLLLFFFVSFYFKYCGLEAHRSGGVFFPSALQFVTWWGDDNTVPANRHIGEVGGGMGVGWGRHDGDEMEMEGRWFVRGRCVTG